MTTNRRASIQLVGIVIACAVAFCSPAFASDAEDMQQINDLYSRLLATYSENCIAKDSLESGCTDVVFANKNNMLSSSLKALLANDAKRAKKNGIGSLDFGFLINGQDYCKAPLRIVSLKKVDNGYVMNVNNGCKREKNYNPSYDFTLINESGRWVIDDAAYYNAKKLTLKGILKK